MGVIFLGGPVLLFLVSFAVWTIASLFTRTAKSVRELVSRTAKSIINLLAELTAEVRYLAGFTGVMFLIEGLVYGQVGLLSLAGLVFTIGLGVVRSSRLKLRVGYIVISATIVTMMFLAAAVMGIFTPGSDPRGTCRAFRGASADDLRFFDTEFFTAYCDHVDTTLKATVSMAILGIILALLLPLMKRSANKGEVGQRTDTLRT